MSDETKTPGNGAGPQTPQRRKRSKGKRRSVSNTFGKGAYIENSATRHQARILALQTLFEYDTTDHELDEIIGRIYFDDTSVPESALESADEDETAVDEVPAEVAKYSEKLARGTVSRLTDIDPMIEEAAPAFPIPQIAAVDRNVLRLAIYELNHHKDVPVGVAINEAVEIAKRFGGDNSSRFVNGVLGTISKQLPPERQNR